MKYPFFLIVSMAFTWPHIQIAAQEIDNTASYRNINAQSYVRAYSNDDYFTNTDEQYTEGINVEICMPWVRKFPFSKLLIHPRFNEIRYGLAIEQAMYTPNDLTNPELQKSDHPFAATLFLKTFFIATDFQNRRRFTSTFSTGVIGGWAQGDDLQRAAHIILQDVIPPAWKFQIKNDAIINYQVNYQKQFLHIDNIFSFDVETMARAGTLSDKAGLGGNLMIGYFESPFSDSTMSPKKFKIYLYYHPEIDVVGYDASLEGGVFDRSSPYTISPNDISRFIYQNRLGIVVAVKRYHLEYNECFFSRQFSTGPSHGFGGVGIAIDLN